TRRGAMRKAVHRRGRGGQIQWQTSRLASRADCDDTRSDTASEKVLAYPGRVADDASAHLWDINGPFDRCHAACSPDPALGHPHGGTESNVGPVARVVPRRHPASYTSCDTRRRNPCGSEADASIWA